MASSLTNTHQQQLPQDSSPESINSPNNMLSAHYSCPNPTSIIHSSHCSGDHDSPIWRPSSGSSCPLDAPPQTPRGSWLDLCIYSSERAPQQNGFPETNEEYGEYKEYEKDQEVPQESNGAWQDAALLEALSPIFIDKDSGEEYTERGFLGKGGFGMVYKVHSSQGEVFALKTFFEDISGEMIQREVDMLKAGGEHGNLVKCFGTVNDDDGPCILYELCMPENLWHLLRNRGAITKEETRFFISKIADGLTHLHGRGLIHCDLKPENVLLAPGMKVRIGDLGLAERYNPYTRSGKRVGTDGYRAPEVVGFKPHTFAMDVYSMGCIAYLMLQGEECWLTKRDKIFPNKLETLFAQKNCTICWKGKKMLRGLLKFEPEHRLQLKDLRLHEFFASGYCPDKLDEDVIWNAPNFINQDKRKPEVEEDAANTKARYNDPYCDTSVLYRTTSSIEANL